uniref:Uncharacterized protein n=1 Tax=Lepeophtheirus salmonis TaxID=72036 RepID=A0A0K2T7R7_LEPSM
MKLFGFAIIVNVEAEMMSSIFAERILEFIVHRAVFSVSRDLVQR